MQNWIKVTLLLCTFGAVREIRPSEPYVSEFLLGEWRNITETQLNRNVYPIGTYSYLALLVIIFLVTDFLRFKPVIILSGISGIIVYVILLWTTSLEWLQASQFFYGLYMATEVAYLTYIYAKVGAIENEKSIVEIKCFPSLARSGQDIETAAKEKKNFPLILNNNVLEMNKKHNYYYQVDPEKYPIVSSFTRMAALAGRFLSGVSAQLLTDLGVMNYRDLNYITLSAQILATFWALWLPPVKYGIYFHRKTSLATPIQTEPNSITDKPIQVKRDSKNSFKRNFVEASTLIVQHARMAYKRSKVIVWSLLYASVLALYVQVQVYVQLLWKEMQSDSDSMVVYNGAVEAATTLLGAGGAYIASLWGPPTVPMFAAGLQGALLFMASYPQNIYLSYVGYTLVGVMFHYTITLASARIASQLSDDSCFGLIFGINTLIGTGLQSLLTFILISERALALPITSQYYVLSGLYVILASVWLCGWIVNTCKVKKTLKLDHKY